MGENNHYRELKQYATKNVTFKQEQLMENAINNKFVTHRTVGIPDEKHFEDPEVFTGLWKGVCAGVSMLWLAQKLSLLQKRKFFGSTFENKGFTVDVTKEERLVKHTAAISEVAPVYKAMTDRVNVDKWCILKATDELAGQWGMRIDAGFWNRNIKTNKSVLALFTDFGKNLGVGKGVYIAYQFVSDNGWHAVGLYKNGPNDFDFFDPNVGEYLVRGANYTAFFTKYLQLVASTMVSELKDSYAYPVLPK
jgi:hypothetical protein